MRLFLRFRFVMRWTIRNDGTTAWPRDCTLRWTEGNHPCCSKIVPVDTVEPGRATTVVVDLATPAVAGWYQSTWKMMSPSGVYFGGNDARYPCIDGRTAVTRDP